MTCEDCKYCIAIEFGYSNYTVEGVDVDCLLGLNEGFPVDRFYGKEVLLANICEKFTKGYHTLIDVDRELGDFENYSNYVEIKKLLVEYRKASKKAKVWGV